MTALKELRRAQTTVLEGVEASLKSVFSMAEGIVTEHGQWRMHSLMNANCQVILPREIEIDGEKGTYGARAWYASDEQGRWYLEGYRISETRKGLPEPVFTIKYANTVVHLGKKERNAYFAEIDEATEILEKLRDAVLAEGEAEKRKREESNPSGPEVVGVSMTPSV